MLKAEMCILTEGSSMDKRRYRFALVRTFDSGNIGASLRAVKNMCSGELWAIDPIHYIREEIDKFAAGAREYSDTIITGRSLKDFAGECDTIYALSARDRKDTPSISMASMALEIEQSGAEKIGFLFGNETNGLNDGELHYAAKTVFIPTPGPHPSLNLAQAVLITAYELGRLKKGVPLKSGISSADKESLFESIWELMCTVFFQKEITAARTRKLIHNAVKKWPLNNAEYKYLKNTFDGMRAKISKK